MEYYSSNHEDDDVATKPVSSESDPTSDCQKFLTETNCALRFIDESGVNFQQGSDETDSVVGEDYSLVKDSDKILDDTVSECTGTGEINFLPDSLDGNENANECSPPSPTCSYSSTGDLMVKVKLGPQWIKMIQDFRNSTDTHKMAHELFKRFLEDPQLVQRCNGVFKDAVYRYLIESGSFKTNFDASLVLINLIKNEDNILNKIGTMYNAHLLSSCLPCTDDGEKPLDAYHNCSLSEQDGQNSRTSQTEKPQESDQASLTDYILQSESFSIKNASIKQAVLERKAQEVLNEAYSSMHRSGGNEDSIYFRRDKIKAGGATLFDALFSPKEILEGNYSGTKTPKNKGNQKYDPKKVTIISELLAWLLENPIKRSLVEFKAYKEQTGNAGLKEADFKSFKKTVLIEHANFRRTKIKKLEVL